MRPSDEVWSRDALWVVPLTVFVLLGTGFALAGHDQLSGWDWGALPLAGAASLTLLLGRTRPAVVMVLPAVLTGVSLAAGFSDGPIYLAVYAGAFVAARALPVARWLPWAAVAVAALWGGLVLRTLREDTTWIDGVPQAVATVALAVSAAAVGSLVRSRRQTAAERAARAATEERLRMAQDLHDGVGHGLAVIAMQAGVALHVLERDPDGVRRALEAIQDTSRESLTALRAELLRLSGAPPSGARRGLADLVALVDRVRAAGLTVSLAGADVVVPAEVDHAAYLLVQESLTNVLRHSDAHSAVVRLDLDTDRDGGALTVSVEDDGSVTLPAADGLGLSGMRHRVAALGGSVRAGSRAAGGFEVRAVIPL